MKYLLRLYPSVWRERYGDELQTLLRDSGAGWCDGFDLLKGALQMRLKFQPYGIAASLILTGTLAGLAVSYLRPQLWEATSVVQFIRFNPTDDGAAMRDLVRSSVSAVEGPRLRITAQPRTEAGSQAVLFSLTASENDPQKAVVAADDAARNLAKRTGIGFMVRIKMPRKPFPERIRDEDRNAEPIRDKYQAFVNPALPAMQKSPGRWFFIAMGFFAGSVLALVTLFVSHRTTDAGLHSV